jgi:hypothetical protein
MWNKFSGCKDIAERDALNEHCIHRQKLLKIKSRVDNRPPKMMPHVQHKAKKELEELKSQAEIQYQNQVLLKKLERIEQNTVRSNFSFKNRTGNMTKPRIEDLLRISTENSKILGRIQSAKPYYSARKQEQDYLFSKYLSIQLSENARRIPRVASYNPLEMTEFMKGKTGRPLTATDSAKAAFRPNRPVSAKQIKENL